MTLQYIKQIISYRQRAIELRIAPSIDLVCNLNKELQAFLGQDYIPFKLSSQYAKFYGSSRTIVDMQSDADSIIAALNGRIAEIPKSTEIINVLEDIEAIEAAISNDLDNRFQCVSRIYHSYCSVISFDEGIKNAARYADGSGLSAGEYSEATQSMLKGLQLLLERYAETLCENKQNKSSSTPFIQVTNNPTISATAAVSVDISVEIENALKQVEDACLSDVQEKEVLAKIEELKKIVELKESSKSKWVKLQNFFKWVAEQGIQVASIIVPILAKTMNQ